MMPLLYISLIYSNLYPRLKGAGEYYLLNKIHIFSNAFLLFEIYCEITVDPDPIYKKYKTYLVYKFRGKNYYSVVEEDKNKMEAWHS